VIRAAVLVTAYLLGSIPFSYIIARRRGVDVRRVGSGNVGATNLMRSVGRGAGLAAFALDFLKGTAATLVARSVSPGGALPALAAATAVLGHMYPVWLRFRGGKGVATACGVFSVLTPAALPPALTIFFVTVWVTKYVSLGSVLASVALAPIAYATGSPAPAVAAASAAAAIIVFRHRSNLIRVRAGTERRIGVRA